MYFRGSEEKLAEIRKIKEIIITKDAGDYYCSIIYDDGEKLPEKVSLSAENAVGIDLGIEKFAALSNGLAIANPGPVNVEKRLKRLQRQLSRKKKGSKNRKKQRIRLQRKYKELRDKREDFLDNVSTAIAKRYDTVIVEDLNVQGMMRNHLAKAITDASWYAFKQELKWKAEKYGKNLVKIGRFDPSSKLCSRCGSVKHDLTLSDRAYR
ncbi:MAG: RNA-guided endonuclease InsQ/TnpB family protein, partial [Thermoprotei archaeon]